LSDSSDNFLKKVKDIKGKSALIVSGESLFQIFGDPALKQKFVAIGERVDVVLACRVSPKQKADIV